MSERHSFSSVYTAVLTDLFCVVYVYTLCLGEKLASFISV